MKSPGDLPKPGTKPRCPALQVDSLPAKPQGKPKNTGVGSLSLLQRLFLTHIQVAQEAGEVVWYSHLFQNFPQFIVIHTVKGFGIVNKAEIDVFLELTLF